ncbi:SPOR domain-containing protein [Shewanella sp. NIFS-20-20]|uniref:SPOR domain-containing protein n=1 Tax=Shewanella sp. NIFS-20-20 TaxID=2853806 RepID=UPI001C493753|nr:SPOR domain-containing protein [Shewanella sp. NIFS-20-20]MBV7315027.1 SPOR domain-containing protein [Shewanella sp. NIFS-20-20]
MSNQFHNRLVGTIVLVALGVIFLPDILDGKQHQEQETFAEIPLRPQSQTAPAALEIAEITPIYSEDEGEGTEVVEPSPAEVKPEVSVIEPAPTPAPAISAKAGWTLQLGSFANAKNVNVLVSQLREAGFATYTFPAKAVDGQLTKVFVGPEINRDKLITIQAKVHKLTDLKGRIVNYDPIQG